MTMTDEPTDDGDDRALLVAMRVTAIVEEQATIHGLDPNAEQILDHVLNGLDPAVQGIDRASVEPRARELLGLPAQRDDA
jgi:hypothetical protein